MDNNVAETAVVRKEGDFSVGWDWGFLTLFFVGCQNSEFYNNQPFIARTVRLLKFVSQSQQNPELLTSQQSTYFTTERYVSS